MRTLLTVLALSAIASPALALTVQPTPTRDQAPHLKPTTSGSGPDIRDSWQGSGRSLSGTSYSSSGSYGPTQTQTFSFGGVTSTVRMERGDGRYSSDRMFETPFDSRSEAIRRRR